MSCAVAVKHARGTILGVDSAVNTDGTIDRMRKIFQVGNVWLALVGTVRAFDRVLVDAQRIHRGRNLRAWVAEACAWCPSVDGIAVRGRSAVAWTGGDAVSEIVEYTATGSGAAAALGALHATALLCPTDRVLAALRAAAAHGPGVAPPFVLVSGSRERQYSE